MNYKDLIIGKIYKTSYESQGVYIFRCSDDPDRGDSYLNIYDNGDGRFGEHGDMSDSNGFEVYHEATDDEIRHFLACESKNKYIPFNEIDCNPLFIN